MQIAIVVYPGMTALDVIGPYEVLRMLPGARLRFVWHEPGPITTDSGVLLLGATHSLDETPSPDIVLIGGSGPATAATAADEKLLVWLRKVHETSTWTTSVCTGSVILAAAGILKGKPATSHWAGLPMLKALGAEPRAEERVVRDGKIVTAAGVSAGIDLGLWLAGEIAGKDQAEAIQLMIEYDPQPPFDSGHMSKASSATRRKVTGLVGREGADLLTADPRAVVREASAIAKLSWAAAIERARARRRFGKR
ncbi:DJ-1/PfpI family protein [Nocardia pseudovaccinii]|uniref:DJ-1/PfpI family protein n=1 Tax=Nocardia pseudovaccinii TaxID=189540 RepID=UPI0007A4A7F7|nr:DJ-1/PfpI family protein [Nocardia pseudovaccinii]